MKEEQFKLSEIYPRRDMEIDAMREIVRAFEALDDQARGRVIDWAFARYVMDPVSPSENATPEPGNGEDTNTCRYCGEVIVRVNDGWRHAGERKGHVASPADVMRLNFGGVIKP